MPGAGEVGFDWHGTGECSTQGRVRVWYRGQSERVRVNFTCVQ